MKINENMKASDPCKTQKSRSVMILPFEKDRTATPVYAAFATTALPVTDVGIVAADPDFTIIR
jgi:hypothetical protein